MYIKFRLSEAKHSFKYNAQEKGKNIWGIIFYSRKKRVKLEW